MCLAVPARVVEIGGTSATVDIGGVSLETSIMLVPDVRAGDYVIVHAGFAIEKLDEEEAQRTLELFKQMAALGRGE